jgi:FdhD protein
MATSKRIQVWVVDDRGVSSRFEAMASEHPLHIELVDGSNTLAEKLTMRTPGHDFELAAGLLFAEGFLRDAGQIHEIRYCLGAGATARQQYNEVSLELVGEPAPGFMPLTEAILNQPAGVTSESSVEALRMLGWPDALHGPLLDPAIVAELPRVLPTWQEGSELPLHAACLVDRAGTPVVLREDLGQANAVDKVIGWALLNGRLPARDHLLMITGRPSFSMVRRAVAAGAPFLCALSSPTTMGLAAARRFGLTLIGQMNPPSFEVYAGLDRLDAGPEPEV